MSRRYTIPAIPAIPYYLFASGRRVYQKDAQLFGSEGFNANVLGTPAVKVSKSHTMLTVSPQWRIPSTSSWRPRNTATIR